MPDTQEKASILICDDEVIIAADLASRLKTLGYDICAQATSGEQALNLVERRQPDLVMMDIVLQGEMDGIDAAEVIRDKWGIPVVFLTAYADTDRLERAKLTYPFGYLLKPFQDRDLKITTEMALYVAKVDGERKKAEAALKLSEERHRIISEATCDYAYSAVQVDDGAFQVEWVSGAFEKTTGYTIEEINDRKNLWLSVVHPDDIRDKMKMFLEIDQDSWTTEYRIYTKTGDIKWLRDKRIEKELSSTGQIRVIGGVTDITVQRQAEETLRESEERFRGLVENLPDIILRFDRECRHLYASPSVRKVVDIPPEQFVGKTHRELGFSEAQCEYWEKCISQVFETQSIINEEFVFEGTTGKIYFDWRLVPEYGLDGSVQSVMSISRDITEEKKAEKAKNEVEDRFKKFFELAPMPYQSLDEHGNFIEVNKSWLNVLGYTREETIGKNFGDFIHPDWAEHFKENFPRFKAIGEILGVEFEMLKKDGTTILVSFNGKIKKDDNGNFERTQCIFHDITAIKTAEDSLRSIIQEKETLLKELNHRVKNNMQVIISLMRLQADRIENEDLRTSFLDTQNRIYAMSAVHENLHQSENLSSVDLAEYLSKLSETIYHTYRTNAGNVQFSAEIKSIPVDLEKSYPIGLVTDVPMVKSGNRLN